MGKRTTATYITPEIAKLSLADAQAVWESYNTGAKCAEWEQTVAARDAAQQKLEEMSHERTGILEHINNLLAAEVD